MDNDGKNFYTDLIKEEEKARDDVEDIDGFMTNPDFDIEDECFRIDDLSST